MTLIIPDRLPESLEHVHTDGLGAQTTITTGIPMSFWQRRRGRGVAELDLEDTPPDVIWALGEDTHELATRMAEQTQAPAVLDIRSIRTARKTTGRNTTIGGWITPGPTLARIVSKRVGPELVECIHPGVEPGLPRQRDDHRSPSIAILCPGEDMASLHTLLSSLPEVIENVPGLQVCLETPESARETAWRVLRSLELLKHVSMVPGAAGIHDLRAQCDLLIQTDRRSPARTIILDAMKHASSVISVRNPSLDWLVDAETAVLVSKPRKDAWTEAILRVLLDRQLQGRLGQAARNHVLHHHGLEEYLDSVLGTFRRATKGYSYPFTLQGAT